MFVDGVRDFGGYSRDSFNMEQVEVAKGPTSTLAGRGSTGGAIYQVSKSPVAAPVMDATFGAGNAGYQRSTIDINQPLEESPVPEAGRHPRLRSAVGAGHHQPGP